MCVVAVRGRHDLASGDCGAWFWIFRGIDGLKRCGTFCYALRFDSPTDARGALEFERASNLESGA